MTSKNDITGDTIRTKSASKKYYDNFDAIFRKNNIRKEEKSNDNKTNTSADIPPS